MPSFRKLKDPAIQYLRISTDEPEMKHVLDIQSASMPEPMTHVDFSLAT